MSFKIYDNTLHFTETFDAPLDDMFFFKEINETIKFVHFGSLFNQSLENVIFPETIEKIYFGSLFNQPLDKVIFPKSLKELLIGYYFDKSLDNLPNTLEKLIILSEINEPLTNLPIGLKEISFYYTDKEVIKKCKIPFGCIVKDG